MIKRYDIDPIPEYGVVDMEESKDGEYFKVEDVKEYLRDYQCMAGLELMECEDD